VRHTRWGWWIEEAGGAPAPLPALSGEIDADVLVVGGGYTGMWAAWWVRDLEPGARVVLLEAERCGLGPSGRNGGFVNSMWFGLPLLEARFGRGRALDVCRAAARSVAEVGRWCERQGIDAHYRRAGYLQASTAPAQDAAGAAIVAACGGAGAPEAVRALDAGEVRARCASPLFRAGAFYPDAATVQPARLALGLRAQLLAAGVEVYEASPARRQRHGGRDEVWTTPSGRVRAKAAVIATGGALAGRGGPRRELTLTSSHMVVTEPVPDVLDELGWRGGECVTDSRAMIHYFRTTADDRIAFGWGGGRIVPGARLGPRVDLDRRLVADVADHLRRFFPQLAGRRIEHGWGGPIDVSPTHLPLIRSLGATASAAFGYTGNGVGPSQMIGRTLASLALDRRDPLSRLALVDPPPVRVPPEPLRFLAGTLIRRALLRKERREELDRPVGRLTGLLASIPERIGVHVGR
jgi:glycine/D-amino acid oxidase-like deaminating enzyme